MSVGIFYFFAALALGSAVVVVTTRNVVHSAFALMVTLFCVAAFYVFLDAGFLAAIQLLVYVGGILVLVLFGVMMTSGSLIMRLRSSVGQLIPAGIVGLILLALILRFTVGESPWNQYLLTEDAEGDVASKIESALVRYPELANAERVAIHPRLYIEFTQTAGYEPDVPPTRALSDVVEAALVRLNTERLYVVKTRPSPDNPRRHLVVVERRVVSLVDQSAEASISEELRELIRAELADRTPEGFLPPKVTRPAYALITNLNDETRAALVANVGLVPVEDLKTVVGLGDSVMMGEFLLPFEIVGVILLIALIGAAVVSRKEVEA